jgi:putative membrane protein
MNTMKAGLLLLALSAAPLALGADLTAADRTFLSDAGTANQKEIDVSRMAQQQASSSAVKSFAATMVRDHTKLGASMKAKFGEAVNPTSSSPPSELSGKTGKDFDKAYMDLMVADHGAVQDKFQQAATGSDYSAAVHKAAAGALPTIKHHAAMAKTLDAKL